MFSSSYHITRSLSVKRSNRQDKTTSRPCFSVIVLVLSTIDASSQPVAMVNKRTPIDTLKDNRTILIAWLQVSLSKKFIRGRVILILLHPYPNMADSYQG